MRRYSSKKSKKNIAKKTEEEIEKIMSLLDPICVGILLSDASKIGDSPKNDFQSYIVKSAQAVINKSDNLSEKWVASINKYGKKRMQDMSLDDPEHSEKDRVILTDLKIKKSGVKDGPTGVYNYAIAENKSGWKYYMTSSFLKDYKEGDYISVKGTIKSNSEGMTFLSRIKIIKCILD